MTTTHTPTVITVERHGEGWWAIRRLPSGLIENITIGTHPTEHAVTRVLGSMKSAGMLGSHECWNVVK